MRRLRVKDVARARGITMSKLQRIADINMGTIRSVWYNPQHDVTISTLERLAKALGVPITELLEEVPDEEEGK